MLNIDLIRHQPDVVRRSQERRHDDATIVTVLETVDEVRRATVEQLDILRAKRNEGSKAIGELLKGGHDNSADSWRAEIRELGEKIAGLEQKERETSTKLRDMILGVANIVSDDVPDGPDDSGNVAGPLEGEVRTYDFPLKPHWELSESLGITDFERGAKLSGRMFYVLGEPGIRLQRALILWMLDLHREKHGYVEKGVPYRYQAEEMINNVAAVEAITISQETGQPAQIVDLK